jgi:hypothetical protein
MSERMALQSHVHLVGVVTDLPPLGATATGLSRLRFRVTASLKHDDVDRFRLDLVCFGRLAERVAAAVHLHDRVVVVGHVERSARERGIEIVVSDIGVSLLADQHDSDASSEGESRG